MDQSAIAPLVFAPPAALPLVVDFQGGRLTSDGGWAGWPKPMPRSD